MTRRHSDPRALINDLIDRLERRPQAQALRAYLDEDAFPSAAAREACIEQLSAIEREGGVAIHRKRIDGVAHILHVRLTNPQVLYRRLGRTPAGERANQALDALRTLYAEDAPLTAILEEVQEGWSRSVAKLGLETGRADLLAKALLLVDALRARHSAIDLTPLDYRTFSRQTTHDSKALERLTTPVRMILDRLGLLDPDGAADEPFSVFGLSRLPQPFLVSGPLQLDGQALPSLLYLGLDPVEALRLAPARPVAYVLIIENFTSFIRHARELNSEGDGLVFFGGGFPSRGCMDAIIHLARQAQAPTFHWGDIDPGGLRIFVHLERALAPHGVALRPHLMSPTLVRARGRIKPDRLRGLSGPAPTGSAVSDLWQTIAAMSPALELEQEALDPRHPLAPGLDQDP